MRFPRMTTRRWMIVVAVTALSLAGRNLLARGREYQSKADHHQFIEDGCRAYLRTGEQRTAFYCIDIPDKIRKLSSEELANLSKVLEHHRALKRKYSRAARYPWLPVEPDPPLPTSKSE